MADNTTPLSERISEALYTSDGSLAFDAMKELEFLLSDRKPKDEQTLRLLDSNRAKMAFVALRFLSENTIEQLFESNTVDIIDLPPTINIIEVLKAALVQSFYVEERNEWRDKWRAAMERCNQPFGKNKIQLGSEQVSPTVSNWLKLYISSINEGRVTNVQTARFLSQNKDVQSLPRPEQAKLKQLISIYEFLRLRSDDLEAYEEVTIFRDENDRILLVGDGAVRELYDPDTRKQYKALARENKLPLDLLADLITGYPEEFGEFRPNLSSTPAVPVATLNPEQFQQNFAQFVGDQKSRFAHRVAASGVPLPNRTAALVAMLHKAMSRGQEADMVLAKEILQFVLSDQERFINFMRHSSILTLLQTELPPAIGEKNKDVVRQSPTSPMALQALLQIVFSQRFKLSPEEAAWQSFEVVQRLPLSLKELKTVVTYDPAQNKLVWRY